MELSYINLCELQCSVNDRCVICNQRDLFYGNLHVGFFTFMLNDDCWLVKFYTLVHVQYTCNQKF